MQRYILVLTVLFVFGCNNRNQGTADDFCFSGNFDQKVEKLSIWDAEKIKSQNGKLIQLEGILNYSFEDVAIYPIGSKESKDALWVHLKTPEGITFEKLHAKRITIIGRVNVKDKGHLNAYLAALDSAFCVKIKNF